MQLQVPPGAGTVTLHQAWWRHLPWHKRSIPYFTKYSIPMEARWYQWGDIWLVASNGKADDRNHLKNPINTKHCWRQSTHGNSA